MVILLYKALLQKYVKSYFICTFERVVKSSNTSSINTYNKMPRGNKEILKNETSTRRFWLSHTEWRKEEGGGGVCVHEEAATLTPDSKVCLTTRDIIYIYSPFKNNSKKITSNEVILNFSVFFFNSLTVGGREGGGGGARLCVWPCLGRVSEPEPPDGGKHNGSQDEQLR